MRRVMQVNLLHVHAWSGVEVSPSNSKILLAELPEGLSGPLLDDDLLRSVSRSNVGSEPPLAVFTRP
jgi:hypothetical protein